MPGCCHVVERRTCPASERPRSVHGSVSCNDTSPQRTRTMRAGFPIILGAFLVLATSLLTGSAVGERHIRRITAADLPANTNNSGTGRSSNNNNVLKTLETSPVTNCSTGSSNGSCGEALPEETKRKAKDKLSELSSDDPHHVVESSSDETFQERLHSSILLHLTTSTPHISYESDYFKDRPSFHTESTFSKETSRTSNGYHDVGTEASGFNSSLTTPRISLFDQRFLRVSESIKQNLQDLEEQHAFSTTTPSSASLETTTASNLRHIPPTAGDITAPNGTKVALEYTNHVAIQYNDTYDPPRSVHRDIIVENGTRLEFTSSFIHTEHFGATTPSPAVEVKSDIETDNHANNNISNTASNRTTNTSQDNLVEEAILVENSGQQPPISTNTSEYSNIYKNTVSPGEIHSTTSSGSPSRSQATTEGVFAAISNAETTTIDSKLNKIRYSTRKIQISGVPITSTEPSVSSTRRSRGRTNDVTTSETVSTTLPEVTPRNRTRARMISSSRHQANATNSVEELQTLTPDASNGQSTRRKQTTRYSWRRPYHRTTNSSEEEETEIPMIRVEISTVHPSTTESSYRKNLIADKKPESDTVSEKTEFTTQTVKYARRRQNATTTVNPPTIIEIDRNNTQNLTNDISNNANTTLLLKRTLQQQVSSNEVVLRNSSKPLRSRGSVRYGGVRNLTGGDVMENMMIPPTAAAWALATLRGPAENESTRVVRRPSKNDTDAEMTTTEQPDEELGTTTRHSEAATTLSSIGIRNSSSSGATSIGSAGDLLDLGFITTQRAFEEIETTVRSDLQSTEVGNIQPPTEFPTPAPDSIQENDMETESIITTELPTSTSSADITNTSREEYSMGTTESDPSYHETTTVSRQLPEEDDIAVTTQSPSPGTEVYKVTDRIPQATTMTNSLENRRLNTTTMEPEIVTEIIETVTQERALDGDDLEESDMLDTTVPPTTTNQPPGIIIGDVDAVEDGHPQQTEVEEPQGAGDASNSGGHEEPDYVAEVDAPPAAEAKVPVATNSTAVPTTTLVYYTEDNTEIASTEAPMLQTTRGTPTTTEEPDSTTYIWSPTFGDVTSYLRITIYSTWQQLCQEKEAFKEALARPIADEMNGKISSRNIVLANIGPNRCRDVVTSDDVEELKLIDVNVYVLNEDGVFDKQLNDVFYVLIAPRNFPSPLEIKSVEMLHGALPTTSELSNAGVIAAITISCIGAACLLLLAILLIIMRKRQKRFNYGQRCTPVSLDAYSLDSVSVYDSVRRKGALRASKRSYGNPGFDDPGAPSHPMNFAGLANFSSDRAALEEEFAIVPQITPKTDELPEGAETKNRYSNVIPLPETRVPLTAIEGEQLSDYINANYVRGPKNEPKFYIACQAPLQSTVTDFWRMVWEQQSKVIIMLTDLVENGVEKCADYLPPSEVLDCHRLFGDFQITLKKREERESYVISTLQLKNLETNLWREVTHLWYLSWPHQGVPEESSTIIAFLIEARPYMRANTGPNIVHCSPGTGRTGAVLACDMCIRDFEQSRMVDIPRCVYRLRRDRAGAVKTRDQYVFIYQVLNTYATKLTGGGGLDSI